MIFILDSHQMLLGITHLRYLKVISCFYRKAKKTWEDVVVTSVMDYSTFDPRQNK